MDEKLQVSSIIAQNGSVWLENEALAPPPPGHIQVRTLVSGISAGTELLLLERSRDEKGEAIHLGYQLCGRIGAVGDGLEGTFEPGETVACYGGPYVRHASHVNVPKNLVARVHDTGKNISAYGYCGLGAVALHAFRCAAVSLGETVAVIGLGMLGNLIAQISRAAGCRVAAMDMLARRRDAAKQCGLTVLSDMGELACKLHGYTDGHYADAVLIVVNNCTDELLADAVRLCRERGRVVIVGTAKAVLPREALFQKEVSVMVSRAGGPGRYDSSYESGGIDYPYAYARWTEGRNLQEYVRLVSTGAVSLDPLLTDSFRPAEAAEAYQLIQSAPENHLGAVFNWAG